jgi:hypothetical protein
VKGEIDPVAGVMIIIECSLIVLSRLYMRTQIENDGCHASGDGNLMRRSTIDDTKWHAIHAAKLLRRQKRKDQGKPSRRVRPAEVLAEKYPDLVKVQYVRHRAMAMLKIPAELTLETEAGHSTVANVVQVIREAVQLRASCYFDFSAVTKVDDAAALLVAAEIDRGMRIVYSGKPPRVRKDVRWHADVEEMLGDMGFFELLRVKNPPRIQRSAGGRRYIRFISGKRAQGENISTLKQRYANLTDSQLEIDPAMPNDERPLYDALMEAMTNVSHHAYPEDDLSFAADIRNRWWVAGSYDGATRRFTVVFYDAGIGIPNSFVATTAKERLESIVRKFGGNFGDAERILAAMARRASRTKRSHRGKGLRDVTGLSRKRRPSRLRIFSGQGEYSVSYGVNEGGEKRTRNHQIAVPGTLIWWEASL